MLCKVLFLFDCCILYKPWSMTRSNLTTGITDFWDKTNFIRRLITDTQLLHKNVTLSYNTKLKLKLRREKASGGKMSLNFYDMKSVFHNYVILALSTKMCLGLSCCVSFQFPRNGQLSKFVCVNDLCFMFLHQVDRSSLLPSHL